MLRIEKVFLQGFKSFCDPAELFFDTEGITAVVGPNGCGKSNIADALSWVIGEQRPKALRGGKMEDVIFQGSRNRPPAGMAEVTLTLVVQETFEIAASDPAPPTDDPMPAEPADAGRADGDEKAARKPRRKTPLGGAGAAKVFHEGERITVARRLYRTGESEYEMNGRACRLRDVQDLFAGTGLGGAHYAIIEQGRIGQVLSAKPLDRRALIEEAAGISKFKLRQRAAELKLEATRQNLSRVTDILAEVERQQGSLKRQAARARRYKRLREESRGLMRAVFVADYRATRAALAGLEDARREVAARESALAAQIARAESGHADAEQRAYQTEARLNDARQAAAEVWASLERARQQAAHLAEQLRQLESRATGQSRDRAAIDERSLFLTREAERLREESAAVESAINAETKSLADAENRHQQLTARDAAAERDLAEAQRRVTESATHRERWRQLLRQFTDAVERYERRLQGLATERERARLQAESAALEAGEIALRLSTMEAARRQVGEALAETDRLLTEQRLATAGAEQRLRGHHLDRLAAEQRLEALLELDARHAHFSEAVQTVINQAHSSPTAPPFRVLGTLADFVRVAPEHEAMIETGLREELQYLIVPSYGDAVSAIEFLNREGQGRAAFLVVGLHGSSEPVLVNSQNEQHPSADFTTTPDRTDKDKEESLSDVGNKNPRLLPLLGLRPEFAELIKQAMPALAGIQLVKDISSAIEASIQANGRGATTSFLTRLGERVVGGRVITGGSQASQSKGILALKREIQALRSQHGHLLATEKQVEEELNLTRARLAELTERREGADAELRQLDRQTAVEQQHHQQCERERARTASHLDLVEREAAQAAQELADFTAKRRHAENELREAEQAHAATEETTRQAHAAAAEIRRAAAEELQELSRRRADFAAKTERRRALQNEIRRLENDAQDLSRRLSRSQLEAAEAAEQSRSLRQSEVKLEEEIQELSRVHAAHQEQVVALTSRLAADREGLHKLDQELKASREQAVQYREERARIEIELAKLSAGLDHIEASCQLELGEQIAQIYTRLTRPLSPSLASQGQTSETSQSYQTLALTDSGGEESAEGAGDEALSFWQVPDDFDLTAAKARLEGLRADIDSLGPVNLVAIDELTEIEERLAFLVTQKADIDRAVADTQAAIAEIKRRSRERFAEAFEIINRHFAEMFTELFGGGHGEMRLIDESDVLESGIDIIAQPPGKRLQNVLLLSGGEKAMAALALVMGIFKYRPSPFCLLDEVDAPLDEVNITRFTAKVLEMSARTQFLVVTHSKRTMESARTLYGVTMEDPGVSKLVSVRLT
jgi:chromosome segregation protein